MALRPLPVFLLAPAKRKLMRRGKRIRVQDVGVRVRRELVVGVPKHACEKVSCGGMDWVRESRKRQAGLPV